MQPNSPLDDSKPEPVSPESALRNPPESRLLDDVEPWLYIVWALVMTPALSRLLVRVITDGKGELGFGGIIFLVGGFAVALVIAISAIVIQRHYVQDDYRVRWLVNLGAIAAAVYVLAT